MHSSKRSILYAWVFSYLTVFLIPIVISIVIYPVSNQILQREIQNANMSLLRQAQQAIDGRLQDINKLYAEISINATVRDLFYSDSAKVDAAQYNRVIQYLRGYKTTNSFLDNIYLYMNNKEGAISYNTYLPDDLFWDRLNQFQPHANYDWKQEMNRKHGPEFMPICNAINQAADCGAVAYLRTLSLDSRDDRLTHLIFLIDNSKFLEPIQNLQWVEGGSVIMLDENNRTIASTSKDHPLLNYADFQGEEGSLQSKHEGRNMTIAYTTSSVTKWKYLSVIPTQAIRAKSDFVRNLTLSGLALSLLLGASLTYFLIRRQYNPIMSLIHGIGKIEGRLFDRRINEYEFIQKAILQSYEEKEAISQVVKKQNTLLKSSELGKWLKGQADSSTLKQGMMSAYNVRFQAEYYWVMLFQIDEKGLVASDSAYKDEPKLAKFIITNTALEIASHRFEVITTELDGSIVFLMNGAQSEDAGIEEGLRQMERQVKSFIGTNYRIPYRTSVSCFKRDIQELPEAYREAMDAMEYNGILGMSEMAFYESIRATNKKTFEWDYYSTMKAEKKLINFIKAGDQQNAHQMLNEIFELSYITSPLSVQAAKYLMLHLIDMMMKTLYELNEYVEESFLAELNPIRRLLACTTLADIRQEMSEILAKACAYIASSKANKADEGHQELKEAVMSFIEENYGNTDMSVSMLGTRFMISSDYLSRLFKEQSGMGLLDYINRCRVEKAKILLQNEELSISEISAQVGFLNSNSFIRTFKKYEGVTPGKYKGFLASSNAERPEQDS